MGSPLSPIIAT